MSSNPDSNCVALEYDSTYLPISLSFSLSLSSGDYILETKPKEISEAQRLNYEQVRPDSYLSRRVFLLMCVY